MTTSAKASRAPWGSTGSSPPPSGLKKSAGRNNKGRIAVRHRGGGHKRRYRVIDFRRDKLDVPGKVERIEYDPNRSANIALICYADGERRYILAGGGSSAAIKHCGEAFSVGGLFLQLEGEGGVIGV